MGRYIYGNMQSPASMGSGFQYGGAGAATEQGLDQIWRESTANSIAMRQKQAAMENEQRMKRDDERQRNILGLSSLSAQALDENSPLYETTMQNGRTPRANGFGVEMSIGDENGSAPAPIKDSFIGLGPLRRTLKPGNENIREQALTPASRTRTVDEALAIEKGKADLEERILGIKNDQRLSLEQKKAAVVALLRGSGYAANDPTNFGEGSKIGDKLVLDVQGVYNQPASAQPAPMQPPPINQPAPIQAPAFSDPSGLVQQYKAQYPGRTEDEIVAALKRAGRL